MNYLLDTHTLIWSIIDEEKLSNAVREALENTDNSIFVSAITYWEISLKFSSGKLKLRGFIPEDMPLLSKQSGFQLIPLSPDESATYYKLVITNHKDPFDRMLIWQAIQRDMVFITSDKSISEYKEAGLKILW